jgi:hypothetical protein
MIVICVVSTVALMVVVNNLYKEIDNLKAQVEELKTNTVGSPVAGILSRMGRHQ